ncbi:MAG: HAD-IIIC family phosphatase [Kiritimatiellae bacterium]|nr:HAD-IIIC family phosphatase [Kiritimatiellia bacterium]
MKTVADFWEEHCIECGEPECYASCPRHVQSRTGRCGRFSADSGQGIRELLTGERTISFRPWGKLELLWHGRMAPEWVRRALLLANGVAEPVALALGPRAYRLWRSLRWRIARMCARTGRSPTVWRMECLASCDETLVAGVADAGGAELFRRVLHLRAGVPESVKWRLPGVGEGALFRISSYDGTAGGVTFRGLALTDEKPPMVKCVAWDLDGTLWDGTLAEDGFSGIRPRDWAVDLVKRLDSSGIVNSVVSKNDAGAAIDALKRLGIEEYFVYPQIGWGAKSVAIARLARQMNIGMDAIAFVDDTGHERAEVAEECRGVAVMPPEEAGRFVEDVCREASPMGSARRRMYREEMGRGLAIERDFGGDAEAFLAASGLEVELVEVRPGGEVAARCRELVQRTNQLTLTARRYGEGAFAELLGSARCRAVAAHDKYGDFGIVGFVAWTPDTLKELVFSCRIAGKGVERRVLDTLPRGLSVEMVATDRNGPIRKIVGEWQKCSHVE